MRVSLVQPWESLFVAVRQQFAGDLLQGDPEVVLFSLNLLAVLLYIMQEVLLALGVELLLDDAVAGWHGHHRLPQIVDDTVDSRHEDPQLQEDEGIFAAAVNGVGGGGVHFVHRLNQKPTSGVEEVHIAEHLHYQHVIPLFNLLECGHVLGGHHPIHCAYRLVVDVGLLPDADRRASGSTGRIYPAFDFRALAHQGFRELNKADPGFLVVADHQRQSLSEDDVKMGWHLEGFAQEPVLQTLQVVHILD